MHNEREEEMQIAKIHNLCRMLTGISPKLFSIQSEAEMNGNYYILYDDRPVFFGNSEQIESVIVLLLSLLSEKEQSN